MENKPYSPNIKPFLVFFNATVLSKPVYGLVSTAAYQELEKLKVLPVKSRAEI